MKTEPSTALASIADAITACLGDVSGLVGGVWVTVLVGFWVLAESPWGMIWGVLLMPILGTALVLGIGLAGLVLIGLLRALDAIVSRLTRPAAP